MINRIKKYYIYERKKQYNKLIMPVVRVKSAFKDLL